MGLRALLALVLDDPKAERVRRNHHEALAEIQGLPMARARVIAGVELADGVEVPIAHRLGRAPVFVMPSAPRGPSTSGHFEEVRGTHDRAQHVVLKASGWGATVTVDVLVL